MVWSRHRKYWYGILSHTVPLRALNIKSKLNVNEEWLKYKVLIGNMLLCYDEKTVEWAESDTENKSDGD